MKIETIYGDLPTLETDRLLLRKVRMDDAEDMFMYGSHPKVSKYTTWDRHESITHTKTFIQFVLSNYANKQPAPWGIEHKADGTFIGTIDFGMWQLHHKSAELGYVISQNYWGQGLATEAAREVIAFGFKKMDLVRIQARCFIENTASARVMEKLGMTYEGTLRKSWYLKGEHQDLKMYSILKDEFFKQQHKFSP